MSNPSFSNIKIQGFIAGVKDLGEKGSFAFLNFKKYNSFEKVRFYDSISIKSFENKLPDQKGKLFEVSGQFVFETYKGKPSTSLLVSSVTEIENQQKVNEPEPQVETHPLTADSPSEEYNEQDDAEVPW
jgi:hypothetical protein